MEPSARPGAADRLLRARAEDADRLDFGDAERRDRQTFAPCVARALGAQSAEPAAAGPAAAGPEAAPVREGFLASVPPPRQSHVYDGSWKLPPGGGGRTPALARKTPGGFVPADSVWAVASADARERVRAERTRAMLAVLAALAMLAWIVRGSVARPRA